ncbi:hypothetical protein [Aromatoleum evansii]|uniref:hypothetical protein n=1 Tax=Aromatoleum evansii TaxID=59406 RepID=UPI00145E2920|nr:hypothetical protein [Aromatoleum evansii]NMG32529.1 hypothetical protein [Aromatoleum evansii]
MPYTLIFVDADNQPPALAGALCRFLKAVERLEVRAIIAGNGTGDRVRGWEQALKGALPDTVVSCHVAPVRKQSADARLMFELAPYYHSEPDSAVLILVISRDELFIAATECLVARGHNAMLAVGAAANGAPLTVDVPVVLLSPPQAPPTPAVVSQAAQIAPAPVPRPQAVNGTPAKIDAKIVTAAITKIRQTLSPNKQGGYAASAVGQVLSQMGHDKATRTKIVSAIPNLKEVGAGSEKRLVF